MGKPYSDDLRRGVVQAIETGHTYEETADLCGVSISSISRFLTRWRRTGNVSPQKFGGYKGYALAPYRRQIERWVDAQPDLTLAELQARLAERDVVVSQTAIFRFLRHLAGPAFESRQGRKPRESGQPCQRSLWGLYERTAVKSDLVFPFFLFPLSL